MILLDAQKIDPVGIWKAVSIVFTGSFGVLGLLTRFKDKDDKITGWGWLSLAGIVISTVLGAGFQIRETNDDAHHSLELLTSIDKGLSPILGSSLKVEFEGNCMDKELAKFCAEVTVQQSRHPWWQKGVWRKDFPVAAGFDVGIFKESELVEAIEKHKEPDALVIFNGGTAAKDGSINKEMRVIGDSIRISFEVAPARMVENRAIKSINDLNGNVAVAEFGLGHAQIKPETLFIWNAIGEMSSCTSFKSAVEPGMEHPIDMCTLSKSVGH